MAQHTSAQQKRVALVVGNAAYAHAPELQNVPADARGVAGKLREAGFNELSLHENLSFEAMRRALQQFSRTAEGTDMAVLYYAGHGIEIDGENYLIPVDANLEHDRDVAFETVSLAQVLRSIDGTGTLRLAILDACRDNPFRTAMQRTGSRTRSIGRGLADIEPSGNVVVAFSAKGGTVAFDGSGPHSPFAHALMEYLAKPGLEIGFVFRQVRDAVLKATGQKQEPFLYGSLGAEPVYFVPAEATPSESSKATEATIFISYASADRDRAEDLAHSLQADGYTVWWDTKLLGGQQYRKAILAQLEMARATIVIWTKASVESDWVYDEASRARAAGKLIPIRVRELDPKEIQPPFGALHTVLFDDRAGLHAALAGRNVLPAPSAAKSAPSSPGPVDERTLEHDYWVAIQASKNPTDFETFLQKFTHGVYDSVARKRVETLIAEASSDLIAHFLREHPNSDRAALARARLVEIEWRKAEEGNDSVKLRASIARYPDSAQIPHAKAALARLEWERIRSSEDAAEIEQVLADLGDTNEAMLARQRLASLHEEDAAWTRAASANDAASLRHYLSVFPRGKHATEVKARLKAMGHPWLWQSLSAAWARLPTKRTVDTLRDFPADYSDGANTHMATAEPAAPLAASQRAKEEKAIPVISFSELLDVIKAFFSRKGYGAERNVFLDPVPDKITKDAKLLFPRSQNERIVAALTSTFSNDAIVFTDCAIYFRAKPFFEKKDRVSYEQLKKREPQSKMSTGNVIFADTRLAMMPYLVVEKRDVLELLVAIRKRLIERSK